jgi:hypothetical protein
VLTSTAVHHEVEVLEKKKNRRGEEEKAKQQIKLDRVKSLFSLMQDNSATSKYFLKPLENAQAMSRQA